jgi:DNA-binding response OmpR family regulator
VIVHVLIAEDSPDVAEVVAFGVRMTWPGSRVTIAQGGEEALSSFEAEPADLVILDVAMPPPDGFEVCRKLRETSNVPIMMLTVRDATIDKVRALDLGADDYLTKPFDHIELLARLRALMRRVNMEASEAGGDFVSGDLSINFDFRQVRLKNEEIRLTSTEYRLLEVLARHAGTTLPHHVLLDRVWGSEWEADPSYLKVFIRRLRQKLNDDAEHPRYIETIWGTGYRLLAPTRTPVADAGS